MDDSQNLSTIQALTPISMFLKENGGIRYARKPPSINQRTWKIRVIPNIFISEF